MVVAGKNTIMMQRPRHNASWEILQFLRLCGYALHQVNIPPSHFANIHSVFTSGAKKVTEFSIKSVAVDINRL